MKIIFLPALLVVAGFASLAQTANDENLQHVFSEMSVTGAHEGTPFYFLNNHNTYKVQGSVFLDEDFKEGVILDRENNKYRQRIRYNAQADEIQVLSNGELLAFFPEKIKAVMFDDRIFVPHALEDQTGSVKNGYLELLVDGEMSLFIRHFAELHSSGSPVVPGLGKTPTASYSISESLYFAPRGGVAKLLKKGKKPVLDALSKKMKEIERYADHQKLSYRKQEDLAALFIYYNKG